MHVWVRIPSRVQSNLTFMTQDFQYDIKAFLLMIALCITFTFTMASCSQSKVETAHYEQSTTLPSTVLTKLNIEYPGDGFYELKYDGCRFLIIKVGSGNALSVTHLPTCTNESNHRAGER